MKILTILFSLIICVLFSQDNNAQDADRYQHNQITVEAQGQEMPIDSWSRSWEKNQEMETCEQMLERTLLEQDSILHNCPEHKLVMLYKCPKCQATSLERVHKCFDKEIELWLEIEPYESGYMKVSNIHDIYYEISGNPGGKPVIVLHGGPGVGSSPSYRRFFNPDKFKIIQFDQRGSGKSKPRAELRENTTQYLIQDIESIRQKLNIEKMIVFGGSWGSTLSLAYAETYPENVDALVLRAVYLPDKDDKDFWRDVTPKFFPYEFEALVNAFPDSMQPPNGKDIFKLLNNEDKNTRIKFAKLIARFEWKACALYKSDDELDEYYNDETNADDIHREALIEYHYISNGCFLEDGQLLRDAYKIKDIPTIIVNGRYDVVCPPGYAYQLHKKLSNSKLIIAEKAGHLDSEKPIQRELLLAMREFE